MRLKMEKLVKEQQMEIIKRLEEVDGKKFRIDSWQRAEGLYSKSYYYIYIYIYIFNWIANE